MKEMKIEGRGEGLEFGLVGGFEGVEGLLVLFFFELVEGEVFFFLFGVELYFFFILEDFIS